MAVPSYPGPALYLFQLNRGVEDVAASTLEVYDELAELVLGVLDLAGNLGPLGPAGPLYMNDTFASCGY